MFLAFQVKADKNSAAMEGLKKAKSAIKKATDELVKVATESMKAESPMVVETDIFKEVSHPAIDSMNPLCHGYLTPRELRLKPKF